MPPIPLLMLSDSVSHNSGLARITRDLCQRVHDHLGDTFEVCSVGYGAPGSKKLPWTQYFAAVQDWEVLNLEAIWNDHAEGRKGILCAIWDCTRVGWMVDPELCVNPALREFMKRRPFELWIYCAVDAEGVNGLPLMQQHILSKFDRVLFYSKWAADIAEKSLGKPFEHLPHGIEGFQPVPKQECKEWMMASGHRSLRTNQKLIGIVATNQVRKDWALGVEAISLMRRDGMDVNFWFHTDSLDRHWDIQGLLQEFGIRDRGMITTQNFNDGTLNKLYSACDVTLGIGSEGFGFPLAESLYCATPVVHMSYAGGSCFVPKNYQVDPIAMRYEGLYALKRPFFNPADWAEKATEIMEYPCEKPQFDLSWDAIWDAWASWFLRGVK
jgi:glycosyltransferase involved in cell wall biosynthesis